MTVLNKSRVIIYLFLTSIILVAFLGNYLKSEIVFLTKGEEFKNAANIGPNDVAFDVRFLGEDLNHSLFAIKIKNVSNKDLYMGDFDFKQDGSVFDLDRQKWVEYSSYMNLNHLVRVSPNHFVIKRIFSSSKIPQDLNIRIAFGVPVEIKFEQGFPRIRKSKTIFVFNLLS